MLIRVYNYNTMDKVKVFEAHTDYIRWSSMESHGFLCEERFSAVGLGNAFRSYIMSTIHHPLIHHEGNVTRQSTIHHDAMPGAEQGLARINNTHAPASP